MRNYRPRMDPHVNPAFWCWKKPTLAVCSEWYKAMWYMLWNIFQVINPSVPLPFFIKPPHFL